MIGRENRSSAVPSFLYLSHTKDIEQLMLCHITLLSITAHLRRSRKSLSSAAKSSGPYVARWKGSRLFEYKGEASFGGEGLAGMVKAKIPLNLSLKSSFSILTEYQDNSDT